MSEAPAVLSTASAPKRMKDVKKGRSFKKMFSSKKKNTSGFRGLDDDDDAKKS